MKSSPFGGKAICKVWCLIFLFLMGCTSDSGPMVSPKDRVIEGPFFFTNEWAEIDFDPALEVSPHIIELRLPLGDHYELEHNEDVVPDTVYKTLSRYKDKNTGELIRPEIVLYTEDGHEYKTEVTSIGWHIISQGTFSFMGYSAKGETGQFFYPKDTKIVSARIRGNTNIEIQHLHWHASDFSKAPERTWDDVTPAEIAHPD